MSPSTSKKQTALIEELFSTDAQKVLTALSKIPEKGDSTFINPLLKTYRAWEHDEAIRKAIAKILFEIKVEAAIPSLIEALDDPDFEEHRAFLISIFWNAGLFPIDHIGTLVQQAIRGDYMVALEVLTVVENMDSNLDAEMLQDAVLDIEEHIEIHPDEPQTELLEELKQILTSHQNI